jgi:hypothetical protein
MDDSLIDEVLVACEYLVHDFYCLRFWYFLALSYVLMEGAVGAVLEDEIVEGGGFDDFVETQDVGVLQMLVDVDLCLQHFQVGASELLQFYDFDRVAFVDLFYFDCLVDFAAESLA